MRTREEGGGKRTGEEEEEEEEEEDNALVRKTVIKPVEEYGNIGRRSEINEFPFYPGETKGTIHTKEFRKISQVSPEVGTSELGGSLLRAPRSCQENRMPR